MKTNHIILAAILAASTALQSAVAENKLPAPKPEFKTQEQLVKWSEEKTKEAAAADSVSANRDSQFFYTGKPYLEEAGTYAFRFRSYDPELARWTSADPSGFRDGANNIRYDATPTSEFDWQGLETKHITLKFEIDFQNQQAFSTAIATGISQGLQIGELTELLELLGGDWVASTAEQAIRAGVLNSATTSIQSTIQSTLSQWNNLHTNAQFLAYFSNSSWSSPNVLLAPATSSGQTKTGFVIGSTQLGYSLTSKLTLSADGAALLAQTADSTLVKAQLNALVEITISSGVGVVTFSAGSSGNQFLRDISGTVRE